MAEAYGRTPAEILFAGTDGQHLSRIEEFHLNADVFTATRLYEEEHRTEDGQAPGPGAASPAEKRQLVQRTEERAQRRESMEEAGRLTPSPHEQLDQLDEVLGEREQARAQAQTQLDADGG